MNKELRIQIAKDRLDSVLDSSPNRDSSVYKDRILETIYQASKELSNDYDFGEFFRSYIRNKLFDK